MPIVFRHAANPIATSLIQFLQAAGQRAQQKKAAKRRGKAANRAAIIGGVTQAAGAVGGVFKAQAAAKAGAAASAQAQQDRIALEELKQEGREDLLGRKQLFEANENLSGALEDVEFASIVSDLDLPGKTRFINTLPPADRELAMNQFEMELTGVPQQLFRQFRDQERARAEQQRAQTPPAQLAAQEAGMELAHSPKQKVTISDIIAGLDAFVSGDNVNDEDRIQATQEATNQIRRIEMRARPKTGTPSFQEAIDRGIVTRSGNQYVFPKGMFEFRDIEDDPDSKVKFQTVNGVQFQVVKGELKEIPGLDGGDGRGTLKPSELLAIRKQAMAESPSTDPDAEVGAIDTQAANIREQDMIATATGKPGLRHPAVIARRISTADVVRDANSLLDSIAQGGAQGMTAGLPSRADVAAATQLLQVLQIKNGEEGGGFENLSPESKAKMDALLVKLFKVANSQP